jgi:hypothetical protein
MGMPKCIDFGVYYDIVKFINNHAEWHDEIWLDDCPATFLPKGANASLKGTMRSIWQMESLDLPCLEVFWFLGRGEITMQDGIIWKHHFNSLPISSV